MHEDDKPQPINLKPKKQMTVDEVFKLLLDRVERNLFFADTGHWPADSEPRNAWQAVADDLIKLAGLLHSANIVLRERYEGIKTRAVAWLAHVRVLEDAEDRNDRGVPMLKSIHDEAEADKQ